MLDHSSATAYDVQFEVPLQVQGFFLAGVEGLLHLRDALPSEQRLVDDAGPSQEEDVTGNNVAILGATWDGMEGVDKYCVAMDDPSERGKGGEMLQR